MEICGFGKRIKLSFYQKKFSIFLKEKELFRNGTCSINKKSFEDGEIKSLKVIKGEDILGVYNSLNFVFELNHLKTLRVDFKLYLDKPVIEFKNTILRDLELPKMEFKKPMADFPKMELSNNKYKIFSYSWKCWPAPLFFSLPSTPIDHISSVLALKREDDTIVLSPVNNFTMSYVKLRPPCIGISLNGEANVLKKGMTFGGIGVFGEGIKDTIIAWGNILQKLYGKPKVNWQEIPFLKYLGYYTDHGAYYYYKKEENASYADTLINLEEDLKEKGINVGYYQIDSWWYSKGKDQGVLTWDEDPNFLPGGVKELTNRLKKPALLHNRYFSNETPLANKFKFFTSKAPEEVTWIKMEETIKKETVGKYPIDSYKVYRELAKKVSGWNCIGYEQDWLDTQFELADRFKSEVDLGDGWLEEMSRAFREFDIPIFYAMPTTGCYLATVKCPNVVSIRTGDDYYFRKYGNEKLWYQNFYCSALAYALGLYPNFDVFIANKQHPDNFEEPCAEEEALARALSCGVVGFGDKIVDKEIINRISLSDGTLVKPDKPALPIERCFESDPLVNEEPLIVYTSSKIGALTWYYVGVWNLCEKELEYELDPSKWGIGGGEEYITYDWFKKIKVNEGKKRVAPLKADFYVLAPLIKGKLAFIADTKRYIGCSTQLVKEIEFEPFKIALSPPINTQIRSFLFLKKEARVTTDQGQRTLKKGSHFIDAVASKDGTKIIIS